MPYGLAIGDDTRVTDWVHLKYKLFPMRIDRAVGIVDEEGVLVGGILLQNYNGNNIEVSYYGPKTASVGIFRSIARIVLVEFNVARATVITAQRNKRLIHALSKMGWRLEGTQRCYYGQKDCRRNTGVRMVLFRSDIEHVARIKSDVASQQQG